MKKSIISLLTLVLICSLLVACGGNSDEKDSKAEGDSKGEPVTIKYAILDPEDSIVGQGVVKFKEYVEAQSNGEMKVEIFFNGQLGGERQVIEAMTMGIVQMSGTGTQTMATFDPAFGMTNLPYIFKDKEHFYSSIDGDLGALYKKKANEIGLEMFEISDSGTRVISNNVREIKTPDDLKGVKMRVPEDEMYADTFKAWGSNVTPLSFTEIYTALQQGAVDGEDQTLELLWACKFMEVQKYLTLSYHMETPICIIADKNFYDKLSPEQQDVIKAASKVENEFIREYLSTEEAKYIQDIKDMGRIVTELTAEQKEAFAVKSAPVIDNYIEKYGLQEYLDAIKKYEK